MDRFHTYFDRIRQATAKTIDALRVELFGKQGVLTVALKELKHLTEEERINQGKALNQIKEELKQALLRKKEDLDKAKETEAYEARARDVTLLPPALPQGYIHPLSAITWEIESFFSSLGFSLHKGPEIEEDYYNFTALRIPKHHPARASQDTFYLKGSSKKGEKLLRTQTSGGQIRIMEKEEPPLRAIIPGRVYRVDDWDATHSPMFHQMEGFVVEKGIHFGHLKGCLESMMTHLFGEGVVLRFRPSFFPFTEPSAEVDMRFIKDGKSQWLEVLGCGMIHPHILRDRNIDPEVYQGFAFGMGIERLAMLKYQIQDLRHFFDNDPRFLAHYGATLGQFL